MQVVMEAGHGFHRISRNFHGKSPAVSGCYSSQCANGHPTIVEYHGHDFLGISATWQLFMLCINRLPGGSNIQNTGKDGTQ